MSRRPTSRASRKPTSSPGSADGPSPSVSRAGLKAGPSGLVPAPASHSPEQGEASLKAWGTSGTYGPLFVGSSPSAALQSSLESKLRARMEGIGSPGFALSWSSWDMPSGPPICALRASGRHTSGRGCSGWPTPTASDAVGRGLGSPILTKNGTWRHRNKAGSQSCVRLAQVCNHLGRPDLAASIRFRGLLMGFPASWAESAPSETPSSQKLRPRS